MHSAGNEIDALLTGSGLSGLEPAQTPQRADLLRRFHHFASFHHVPGTTNQHCIQAMPVLGPALFPLPLHSKDEKWWIIRWVDPHGPVATTSIPPSVLSDGVALNWSKKKKVLDMIS